ncbi:nucleolysin TIAR-like [Centruroides sculpturatus]|uniref:nucleolysin TIAR-like n=1 Tax=Centruroides sculpturatus TaxID=218467 RepID=UPI000C6DA59A|nr:nucleolysin TIAR-like [Centruroides sculpturatus]
MFPQALPGNDPYCFVEFTDHQAAAAALLAMNKRQCLGKEMKVNWATSPSNTPKQDTSKHYHIFVGDLSPEIETQQLREAFAPFGEISDCRVVRDPQTLKSKGYGFVSFVKKADAETAISTMNGQWLGSRAIRTNWATRKPPANRTQNDKFIVNIFSLDVTYYLLDESLINFQKFSTKEAATHAIVATHNTDIIGQTVKCSWGKESGDPNNQQQQQNIAAQYTYPYQQMGYWYPQSYPQIQGQFVQGMQYPFSQYYGQGFGMGMQMAWQGIPGQPQMAAAAAAAAAAQNPMGQGLQQPGMIGTYPMQQYQAQ